MGRSSNSGCGSPASPDAAPNLRVRRQRRYDSVKLWPCCAAKAPLGIWRSAEPGPESETPAHRNQKHKGGDLLLRSLPRPPRPRSCGAEVHPDPESKGVPRSGTEESLPSSTDSHQKSKGDLVIATRPGNLSSSVQYPASKPGLSEESASSAANPPLTAPSPHRRPSRPPAGGIYILSPGEGRAGVRGKELECGTQVNQDVRPDV